MIFTIQRETGQLWVTYDSCKGKYPLWQVLCSEKWLASIHELTEQIRAELLTSWRLQDSDI